MGVFDYAASGLAEGVGRGLAAAGTLEYQAQQNALRDDLRQQDRLELLAAKIAAQTGGGRGGKGGPSVLDLAALPDDQLRRVYALGGMTSDAASAAVSNVRGETAVLPPGRFSNPDRQDAAAAAPEVRYKPGGTEQQAKDAFVALRRAMGLGQPGASDDIAKAEGTERTGGLVDRYVGSGGKDEVAGEGVLLSQGKSIRSGTTGASEITGVVPKGSVGEAMREKDFGAGAESRAKGNNAARGEDGLTLRSLQQQRLSLSDQIDQARKRIDGLQKSLSRESESEIAGERAFIKTKQTALDRLDAQIADLSERLTSKSTGAGGGPKLAPGKLLRFDANGNLVQ